MKKRIILSLLYLIIAIAYGYYLYYNYQQKKADFQQQIYSGSNITFSGNVFSGSNILTGTINNTGITIETTKSEKQKFVDIKKDGFLRVFNPPKQPSLLGINSYQTKSNILNKYLKENNFYFQNSLIISDGYLYIKLAKPIKQYDIFLYFHDSQIGGYPMSGKIAKEDNLIVGKDSEQEFLFKLNDVSIYRYYDGKKTNFNWLGSTINQTNKVHFIGGYTTGPEGNQIEEIIITGK